MISYLVGLTLISQATTPDFGWVKTDHHAQIHNRQVHYQATAGLLPLTNSNGEVQARIYFTSYVVSSEKDRPITFVWNGGPGSSSFLLHMFCMGPRRLAGNVADPNSTFKVVDNENSILPSTDLVFVDPVGTGFSFAENVDPHKFWGVDGDIEATRKFIRMYLEATHRKASPVFIAGESYGTFRAAGVSKPVLEDGIHLKGIIFLSSIVDYHFYSSRNSNDLPYLYSLPTGAAIAAHFNKLRPEWNGETARVIKEAVKFAANDLAPAIKMGKDLDPIKRHDLAVRMATFTSLSPDFFERVNLRAPATSICAEMFSKEGKLLNWMFGTEFEPVNFEPPRAVASFNDYIKKDLGYVSATPYCFTQGSVAGNWALDEFENRVLDESPALKSAMNAHPEIRLFVGQGIYDCVTPFMAAHEAFSAMGLAKSRWEFHTYDGGHMMYMNPIAHRQLEQEVTKFLKTCKT
jgi:carboxypeptidase C (cathepsin A)